MHPTLLPGFRCGRAVRVILLVLTLCLPMRFNAQTAAAATSADTNLPRASAPPVPGPRASQTRTKAGFLAGAGLAVLSLLILAAGLALVRTFKQR